MLRTLLLLAALLPEARAEDRLDAEMTIRVLDFEVSVPTESSSLPESLGVSFWAPDSLTVEVTVAEDGGGYGILLFDTTSSSPTLSDVHDWWSLCLEDDCPPIEVAIESGGQELALGIFKISSSPPRSGPVGTPEWRYVSIRQL